jgi:tRNA threonylcarbamoyladenosine biosynthesis protein TsaE
VELSVALLTPPDTDALGAALAQSRPPGPLVAWLRGDLGAGKSTLARAMLRALGVEGAIRSPTYTLVECYPLPDGEAVHLDLYRIAAAGELEFLGLDDLRAEASLWLVEWPERGGAALPAADLEIALAQEGEGRRAQLRQNSEKGGLWLAAFSKIAPRSPSV